MTKHTTPTVGVTYIGRRDPFRDHLYGSGLTFERGQTRELPTLLARQFLRHADLFEAAGAAPAAAPEASDTKPAQDDTQELLAKADQAKAEQEARENQLQDLYASIDQMPKTALLEFAKANYRHDLDKTAKVGDLRTQVRALVDQFGTV